MLILLDVICRVIALLINVVIFAMFLRAILSFFAGEEESRFSEFLYVLTEPFIVPIRALLAHFHIGEDSPVDMSFFLTYLTLVLIQAFLPIL